MASPARAALESLLQAKQLDRTLTTAVRPDLEHAPAGLAGLDARLGGGFPRGELSELIGPRSSGRTSVLLRALAAATARGELVALIDALDMLDPETAQAAGVRLDRLLWIRGHVVPNPGFCRDVNQRAVEQVIRAVALVLQAGNFGLVAFDLAEAPPDAIRRVPFTTWLRLQRMVEGGPTACVLVGSVPMARSSAGLTVRMARTASEGGVRFRGRLLDGLDIEARIVRTRGPLAADVSTAAVSLASSSALLRDSTSARLDWARRESDAEGNGPKASCVGVSSPQPPPARRDRAARERDAEANGPQVSCVGVSPPQPPPARRDRAACESYAEGNGPKASCVGVGPHA